MDTEAANTLPHMSIETKIYHHDPSFVFLSQMLSQHMFSTVCDSHSLLTVVKICLLVWLFSLLSSVISFNASYFIYREHGLSWELLWLLSINVSTLEWLFSF